MTIKYEIVKKGKTPEESTFKKVGIEVEYTLTQRQQVLADAENKISELDQTTKIHKAYVENIKRNHPVVQNIPTSDIKKAVKIFTLLNEGKSPKASGSLYAQDFTAMFELFKTMHTMSVVEGNRKHYKKQIKLVQAEIDETMKAYGK